MTRILVIEDDAAILEGLVDTLEAEGYRADAARDGIDGCRRFFEHPPDLLILDLMLPGMSGYEICKKIREADHDTPVLMLTARSDEADRVLGLDLGADDYVTKPFSVRELLARVRARLRRRGTSQTRVPVVEEVRIGDVVVNFLSYEARKGDERLSLTPKEFGLLRALVSRVGTVVTRDELLDEVWGCDATPITRTVDNHVASLRTAIEPDPSRPCYLLTVHGVGYKWVGSEGGETNP